MSPLAGSMGERYAAQTASDVQAVKGRLAGNADALVQMLAGEAWGMLKGGTPVDTGLAAGNWNLSTGAPDPAFSETRLDPSREGPPPETLGQVKAGDVVFVVNATPYIEALEYGHSKQQPAGWVRRAAQTLAVRAQLIADRLASKAAPTVAYLGERVRYPMSGKGSADGE